MYDVSIIVPTLNEQPNIDLLIERISLAASTGNYRVEILFVDDGSTDGTRECIQRYENRGNISLLCRNNSRGLSGAVLAGAAQASSPLVVVMDADLSHPPEKIKEMVTLLQQGSHDMVIGSRYTEGGATPDWPMKRKVSSRLATIPARIFTEAKDPLAGFFGVHRHLLIQLADSSSAIGFKIGLEILAAGGSTLRVAEIPIVFHDRMKGQSKMGGKVIAQYLQQLLALAGVNPVSLHKPGLKRVGILGAATDILLFFLFTHWGISPGTAHLSSFLLTLATGLPLYHFLVKKVPFSMVLKFLLVSILALLMRGGLLSILYLLFHWTPNTAILPTVACSTFLLYFGCSFSPDSENNRKTRQEHQWLNFALWCILFTIFLRFLYLGTSELLQEEAYYWNYAQHMDIGYLDHPPMVAVLIWLGTTIFGHSEFGVRIASFLCWFVTAYFAFALTASMFHRTVAVRTLLLIAILPIFAGAALVITPDSPLVTAWAGTLFYLYRALVQQKSGSWLGVGICLGLGMMSKYTIAFLGPAIIIFMLIDAKARKWFFRPQPYLAAILALALFSPVIIWNAQHEWASFFFQSQGRLAEESQFSTHLLLGSILLLLTPTGLLAALAILWPGNNASTTLTVKKDVAPARVYWFCTIMTLVPLSIFILFSLSREIKLNWTGPLWLALLPLVANSMIPAAQRSGTILLRWSQQLWKATVISLVLLYGCALHYFALGLPGLGYTTNPFLFGFPDLAEQIEEIIGRREQRKGARALVVGMDKYKIASGLSYYRYRVVSRDSAIARSVATEDTTGAHIFTYPSLMYKYWFPATRAEGKEIMVLSEAQWPMLVEATQGLAKRHGKIRQLTTEKNGRKVSTFHFRFVNDYHAPKEQ